MSPDQNQNPNPLAQQPAIKESAVADALRCMDLLNSMHALSIQISGARNDEGALCMSFGSAAESLSIALKESADCTVSGPVTIELLNRMKDMLDILAKMRTKHTLATKHLDTALAALLGIEVKK